MKKLVYILLGAAAIMAVSCNKFNTPDADQALSKEEIVFSVNQDYDAAVYTKASIVTDPTTLYVRAATASAIVENFSSVAFTKGGDSKYKGEKYWPSSNGSWNFAFANMAITGTYNAPNVVLADANTDIIVGTATPTYKTEFAVTLGHIFAQVGTVTMKAPAGYTVENCKVSLQPITAGTYTISSGSWGSLGAAGAATYIFGTAGAGLSVTNAGVTSGDNDLWLVPGSYTLTATYTITKGDYSNSFTKTATVTLQQGKNNNIGLANLADPSNPLSGDPNIPVPTDISEIVFTVTVTPWDDVNIPANFS